MSAPHLAVLLLVALIPGPGITADRSPPFGTLYLTTDPHRNVVMATDNAGKVVAITEHRPWGDRGPRTRGMQQVRRTFDGWERDDATGLLYAGARYYDPRLGRFLSVDPAGQAVYVALGSAPLEFVDPDGRVWFTFRAKDGSEAFKLNHSTGRYVRVPGSVLQRVFETRRGDDVFLHDSDVEATRHYTWDHSYMNGVRRDQLLSEETRKSLLDGYINTIKEKLPTETVARGKARERIRGTIREWMRRARAPLAGTELPHSPPRSPVVSPEVVEESNTTVTTAQAQPNLPTARTWIGHIEGGEGSETWSETWSEGSDMRSSDEPSSNSGHESSESEDLSIYRQPKERWRPWEH